MGILRTQEGVKKFVDGNVNETKFNSHFPKVENSFCTYNFTCCSILYTYIYTLAYLVVIGGIYKSLSK